MNAQRVNRLLQAVAVREIPEQPDLWQAIQKQAIERRKPASSKVLQKIKHLEWAVAILIFVFGVAFAVSPTVRAQTQDFIRKIGSLLFVETGKNPYDNQSVTVIESSIMSLEESRSGFPSAFKVLTWTPEIYNPIRTARGLEDAYIKYVLSNEVQMIRWSNGNLEVGLRWKEQPETFRTNISLSVRQIQSDEVWKWMIGLKSVKEIQVNGKPAGLVQGFWFNDGNQSTWRTDGMQSLFWRDGNLVYRLQCPNGLISDDQMVRMAETAR